ncbi:hypothetical protein [Streptomyces sp. L2]|uniref:hypothetical protein n=1 Tax=Streptomyces sp. L2 TaxID=2162665 RepID=UPI0010137E3A|nr:hypothetical protein [Streptomyces sp. L2]
MRKRMLNAATATTLAVAATLLGTTTASAEQHTRGDRHYCAREGGEYHTYVPLAGQVGAGQPLGGSQGLCAFWDEGHQTKITVTAEALNAHKATLAELAYNHPPKPNSPQGVLGQPAHDYCTQLGGTWNMEGKVGYWVVKGQESKANFANTTDLCVFPDMSAIDTWGLLYHAQGVIRGQDLTSKWHAAHACPPGETPGSDNADDEAGDSDDDAYTDHGSQAIAVAEADW